MIAGSRRERRADLLVSDFADADLRTNAGSRSWLVPYVRTVKTGSGATAVQVVWGSRSIQHISSAHGEAELEALKAAARQRMAAGQLELRQALQAITRPG